MARELGVKKLHINWDSNLVIKQLNGQFGVKEESPATYREAALQLLSSFEEEARNDGEQIAVFKRRKEPSLVILPLGEEAKDWRKPILEQLRQKASSKVTREYRELRGILYKKSAEGLLMKCVSNTERVQKTENLNHAVCGEGAPSLYRRMQRNTCDNCGDTKEWIEVNMVDADWRKPVKEYLEAGVLPTEPREAERLKKKVERYFCRGGELFKNSFTRDTLRCIGKEEQEAVMSEVHGGVYGRHQGGKSLWTEILKMGYYWPRMKDAAVFARKCVQC
ncbi:Ribonuclease H superfamily [Sesbania bispinosa]|nr:Ribonuclease H superfamily [Sesbania bispinosa]